MRRWVMLATLLTVMLLETGCGDGMAYDARARRHKARKIFENDMKQLADDVDLFLLNDRNLRTSGWTTE